MEKLIKVEGKIGGFLQHDGYEGELVPIIRDVQPYQYYSQNNSDMQKNLNLAHFPGLVLLPNPDGSLPALPPPNTQHFISNPSSYYVPYHKAVSASQMRQPKIQYNNWQTKLKKYLDIPHPGVITCVRCQDKRVSFVPFMKNEIWMNSDTIPFDWMNVQGICHPMARFVTEKQMPKTIFIDLTFIDDVSMLFYKSLKFLLDGIKPPTDKYQTCLFEFQNIVIFGDRYPPNIGVFPTETWEFFDIEQGEIYVLPFMQATHEIHLFHNIEFKCPCTGCWHTRNMKDLMKELTNKVSEKD